MAADLSLHCLGISHKKDPRLRHQEKNEFVTCEQQRCRPDCASMKSEERIAKLATLSVAERVEFILNCSQTLTTGFLTLWPVWVKLTL